MFSRVIKNTFCYNLDNGNILREVTMEILLDSGAIELVMSSEFPRKQGFKLKKIKRPIYIRNVSGFFDKEAY